MGWGCLSSFAHVISGRSVSTNVKVLAFKTSAFQSIFDLTGVRYRSILFGQNSNLLASKLLKVLVNFLLKSAFPSEFYLYWTLADQPQNTDSFSVSFWWLACLKISCQILRHPFIETIRPRFAPLDEDDAISLLTETAPWTLHERIVRIFTRNSRRRVGIKSLFGNTRN